MAKTREGRPANVLIVDADRDYLHALANGLGVYRKRFQTAFAASIAKARMILSRYPVHVLVTDVKLSGESGIDLLLEARRDHPGTQVIMTSAVKQPVLQRSVYGYGAAAFFVKPFSSQDLGRAILELLGPQGEGASFFDELRLLDLLQLVDLGGHTVEIQVTGPDGKAGRISVLDGCLADARTRDGEGIEALVEMIGWQDARIQSVRACPVGGNSAGGRSLRTALMQAMQRMDEA